MSRGKDLAKSTTILSIGTFFTKIINFLLIPIYTAFLSTSEYGTVEIFNTVSSVVIVISTLQLEQAVFRQLTLLRTNPVEQRQVITASLRAIASLAILATAAIFIFSTIFNYPYTIYLILATIFQMFFALLSQVSRGIGHNKNYAAGQFVSALISVSISILLLTIFNLGIEGVFVGTILGFLFATAFLIISERSYLFSKPHPEHRAITKNLLSYSLPLVPNSISWWVFNSSDKIITDIFLGASSVGLLGIAYKFPSIMTIIYNVFNLSWTESLIAHIKDTDVSAYFSKIFNLILTNFLLIISLFFTTLPLAWPFLVNSNFHDAYFLIPVLLIATVPNIIIGLTGAIYLAKKNTKEIMFTSIFAAIINVLCNLILIHFIGLYAATISTLIAYTVLAIYRIFDVRKRYFKIIFSYKELLLCSAALISSLLVYFAQNKLICLILTILLVTGIIYYNRKLLFPLLKTFKRKVIK